MDQNQTLSRQDVLKIIAEAPDVRLPLPAAFTDPAFKRCMMDALETQELIDNFDRLTGSKLGRIGKGSPVEQAIDKATGFQDDQIRKFSEFVHDCVYMRLAPEALHALRLSQMSIEHAESQE